MVTDVRQLDVAMDDPFYMGGLQTVDYLDGQFQQFVRLHRFSRDVAPQVLAFQELHHDEGLSLELVDIVDHADIRMIQRGGCTNLTPEVCDRLRAADHTGRFRVADHLLGIQPTT